MIPTRPSAARPFKAGPLCGTGFSISRRQKRVRKTLTAARMGRYGGAIAVPEIRVRGWIDNGYSLAERVMGKGKRKPPKLTKPSTALLELSIDELLAEHDAVLKRSHEVLTVMRSGRTSRSVSDLSAEHDELMKRSREFLNAIDYKRSKTFRRNSVAPPNA